MDPAGQGEPGGTRFLDGDSSEKRSSGPSIQRAWAGPRTTRAGSIPGQAFAQPSLAGYRTDRRQPAGWSAADRPPRFLEAGRSRGRDGVGEPGLRNPGYAGRLPPVTFATRPENRDPLHGSAGQQATSHDQGYSRGHPGTASFIRITAGLSPRCIDAPAPLARIGPSGYSAIDIGVE